MHCPFGFNLSHLCVVGHSLIVGSLDVSPLNGLDLCTFTTIGIDVVIVKSDDFLRSRSRRCLERCRL